MNERRKKISVCTGTYNEEGNIREFYNRIRATLKKFPEYDYEIIVADNCSSDRTREILREIATSDKNFKCIFNANNFGAARSGYNGFLNASGDCAVLMCSDLQDPPEMLESLIRKWQEGFHAVCAVKGEYTGSFIMRQFRRVYYRLLNCLSEIPLIRDFHGFGLYDRKILDALKQFKESVPYFRGVISEIGFKRIEIPYKQENRKAGKSSYNLFSYYDYAMSGFVNYSKLPLRLAVFTGFFMAGVSLLIALGYLTYKLVYWETFQLGLAPLVIGLFFFSAIQLIFIGIIGEYLGAVWTQVKNKPLVIEDERINFTDAPRS